MRTISIEVANAKKGSLRELLQAAYSGELAAAFAYKGHMNAVSSEIEKLEILKIANEELHHRSRLGEMIFELGGEIDLRVERKMNFIGKTIGAFCFWTHWMPGSWFIAMYGAGRLESHNIKEYEDAARLAWMSGQYHLVEELLHFAEVEWDHEKYFRAKTLSHGLSRVVPMWKCPNDKEWIRVSFGSFISGFNSNELKSSL